jgi:serine/threonine-protein kinase
VAKQRNPLFHLGRYEVLERIGAGGMAEAFFARAPSADGIALPVVIKRVLPHLATSPDLVNMFRDEARIMSELRHANIVRLLEFGEADGQYFLVMEQVEGPSLADLVSSLIARNVAFPVSSALFVAMEVARALDFAHTRTSRDGRPLDIVHRDVSPSNVLLSIEGEVKLSDFGIARARDRINETVTEGVVRGKIGYLAPETLVGPVDPRADLYALGVVLWELLAGEFLLTGSWDPPTLARLVKGDWPRVSARRTDVPADVEALVASLLSTDPATRPQRARDVVRALAPHVTALESPAEDLAKLIAAHGIRAAPEVAAPALPTVLVVDQSATWRALLRRALSPEYTVVDVSHIDDALATAQRVVPAAVVSQQLLERGTGIELCELLRGFPECRDTPFVLLASDPSPDLVRGARAADIAEVLPKSGDTKPLLAALRRLLGTGGAEQTLDLPVGASRPLPRR